MPRSTDPPLSDVDSATTRRVLDAARVGLFRWDRKADAVTLSDSTLGILGCPSRRDRARLTSKEWLELFHPNDREQIDAGLRGEGPSGGRDLQVRIRRCDDSWMWVRCASLIDTTSTVADPIFGALVDVGVEKGSGARLETLLESTGTGIWDWSVATNRLVTNDAYHSMLGEVRPERHLDGSYFFERIHPDDAPRIRRAVERALAESGRTYDVEVRLRCSGGGYRWVRATGSVVERTTTGAPHRMIGYHFDAHDYVVRRQRLVALEQNLRLFVEHTPAAVAMFDRDIRYIIASRGWYEQYGLQGQSIIGRSHYEVFPTIPVRWRSLHQRALAGEQIHCDRDPFVREDGTTTWVRWSLHPWRDDADEIGGIIMFTEVVTNQVEHELALEEACRQAEAANTAKSAFLASMSHEIRTPMNGIIGMTDLLLDTQLSDPQRQSALVVRRSANALLTIINDILDFSKVEAGKLDLETRPFSVRRLVADVLELMSHKAQEKALAMTADVTARVPEFVIGDEVRIRQILLNLVGNAIKFTEVGSVSVDCDYEEETDRLRVEVRDTGIGIPADKQPALFEAFSQVDASITRRFGGTGLGLTISRRLARLMRGDIVVQSRAGRGSTFCLVVPLPPTEHHAARPPENEGPSVELPRLRVLLADDNAVNRKVGVGLLERLGHDVATANDGAEVLHLLEQGDAFDVILMDVQMPELDGISATRAIRTRRGTVSSVPIIALTAHALKSDEQACLDAGMNGYLTKPIRADELRDALHRLLGGLAMSGDTLDVNTIQARSAPSF